MIVAICKYNWVELFLITLGIIWIIKGVIWPVVYVILFSIGYTIIHAIAIPNWKQFESKHYFKMIRYIFWIWPIDSFRHIGFADEISIGIWTWRPLLIFKKRRCEE